MTLPLRALRTASQTLIRSSVGNFGNNVNDEIRCNSRDDILIFDSIWAAGQWRVANQDVVKSVIIASLRWLIIITRPVELDPRLRNMLTCDLIISTLPCKSSLRHLAFCFVSLQFFWINLAYIFLSTLSLQSLKLYSFLIKLLYYTSKS